MKLKNSFFSKHFEFYSNKTFDLFKVDDISMKEILAKFYNHIHFIKYELFNLKSQNFLQKNNDNKGIYRTHFLQKKTSFKYFLSLK